MAEDEKPPTTPAASKPPAGEKPPAAAGKTRAPAAAKTAPAKPAEKAEGVRTVLKAETVLIIPDGVDPKKITAAAKALGIVGKPGAEKTTQAWVVIGDYEDSSKRASIEAYTGPAGEPETKVGDFKAPPKSGWAGGRRNVAPPKPLVQGSDLDD